MKLFEITDKERAVRVVVMSLTGNVPWNFKKEKFEDGREYYSADGNASSYVLVRTNDYKDSNVLVRLSFLRGEDWVTPIKQFIENSSLWDVVKKSADSNKPQPNLPKWGSSLLIDDYHLRLT